ncbi:peptidoglycan/xylan/chitin deacetylase (PgdA/CDA1 family) [Pedobacter sp. CG_S7]|uniref:polysaccharide deacetylase family protein n=1 Tax=Pedobacter sp. CG_S7 TaxID=3143930 RepID=UPI00339A9048
MKYFLLQITAAAMLLVAGCQSKSQTADHDSSNLETTSTKDTVKAEVQTTFDIDKIKVASAKTILARKQVPVLCYHQIRDWKASDSKASKDYIIPIATFKEHMKMLADSGYHTILPDQYYDYLNNGTTLPSKPIMITFDDTEHNQHKIAAPEMKKYGFKAVFFIMTVSIGRPNYMTRSQIKELSDNGNIIGSHTWDHHNVKKYQGKDWELQIEKPTKTLEEITGKKITDFAYPFGLWNPEAIPELKKRGMKSAYILATKRDENDPLYTIRRIIASGYWSSRTLNNSIKNSF